MIHYEKYLPLFAKYGIKDWECIPRAWQEPHRFYHNEEHLAFLLEKIEESNHNNTEKEILQLIAFFHDIVYQPTAQDNELQSARLFEKMCKTTNKKVLQAVKQAILDTQTHQAQSELSVFFCKLDLAIVEQSSFLQLLEWEKKIFKEYQIFDYSIYKKGRLAVLENLVKQCPQNKQNLCYLIEYLQQYKPNIGVYPGSFNPFHNGHYNILQKAEQVFDKVIIARGVNPEKDTFAEDKNISPALYYRQTESFEGLLTDYLSSKEKEAHITLIRGLRNGDDLAYEMNQISFMKDLKSDLKVVFFHCDREFEHISSSAIRNLEKIGKDLSKKYLPI
jgi:pantetheine-phosphate adenylyltransferase